jgi:hypothetical protein
VSISISRKVAQRILIFLMLLALSLCFISLAQQFYVLFLSRELPPPTSLPFLKNGVIDLLDVDNEESIPTWLSSSLLLLCSVLLAAITVTANRNGERYVSHWGAMSIIFAVLSIDETLSIHTRADGVLRYLLGIGGFFYYAWVIPGGAFVIIFALAYIRFLVHLSATMRLLIIAAGVLYVSGAVGMEMLNGSWAEIHGWTNLTYQTMVTVEEFLEMTGAILLLYALMMRTDYPEKSTH